MAEDYVILITGSRHYHCYEQVQSILYKYKQKCLLKNPPMRMRVIVGDAKSGVDVWTAVVCEEIGIPFTIYIADWATHKRGAGARRNQKMVNLEPDRYVAIWDGKSPGTLDCITRAVKKGIPGNIYPIKPDLTSQISMEF